MFAADASVLLLLLFWRSVMPVPLTSELCAFRTTCGDCLAELGCQWCAAETMWSNTTQSRCRRRPLGPEQGWCPSDQLIDPVDTEYAMDGEHVDIQHSPFVVTPEQQVVVKTRRNVVDITFNVKIETGRELQQLEVSSDTEQASVRQWLGPLHADDKWTVYAVNASVTTSCTAPGGREVTLGLASAAVLVRVVRNNCACDCGGARTEASARCGGHGALHCGGCECQPGWSGARCELKSSSCQERGDQSLCRAPNADNDEQDCGGEGQCVCGRCECPPDEDYFDEFCTDLCYGTALCALCHLRALGGGGGGGAQLACSDMCLGTELAESARGRRQQRCVTQDDGCNLQYDAWREGADKRVKLVASNCTVNALSAGIATGGIMGVLAGALVGVLLLAGGGLALWRSLRAPRDALASLQYEHMDAQMNQGENPLYKPPTKKYVNPLYQPK